MVVVSLPTTIENFEGEVSHVVVAGNETLTFIKPFQWQEERKKISLKLHSLAPLLKRFQSLSAVKSGKVILSLLANLFRVEDKDTFPVTCLEVGTGVVEFRRYIPCNMSRSWDRSSGVSKYLKNGINQ
uniref:PsbP domain-containing protein n=1 Tax=Elaeophora elaphi TaxID=1147741 RepID=A0A0R3RP90_9BILA